MSYTQSSLIDQASQALMRARLTGLPVPMMGGMVAMPNGTVTRGAGGPGVPLGGESRLTPGGAVGGNQPLVQPGGAIDTGAWSQGGPGWQHAMAPYFPPVTNQPVGSTITAPSWLNPGNWNWNWLAGGTPTGPYTTQEPPPLGVTQLPEVTVTAQAPGRGPTVPPDRAADARNYRLQHGVGSRQDLDTDRLNQLSLQAAQQGRTYLPPGLTIAPQAASQGVFAPNLLVDPSYANNYAQALPNRVGVTPQNIANVHWLQNIAQNQNQAQGGG